MVWSQTGLFVWLISNYKGQVKLSLQTHRHEEQRRERRHASNSTGRQKDARSLAHELIGQLQLLNRIEKHQLSFSLRSQKITGIVTTAAASWGRRQATFLIYLVVDTLAVESYVNGEGGGVVVRDEQRLLVRFVPHHKVQWGGALMEKTHVGYQEGRRGTKREETCC